MFVYLDWVVKIRFFILKYHWTTSQHEDTHMTAANYVGAFVKLELLTIASTIIRWLLAAAASSPKLL